MHTNLHTHTVRCHHATGTEEAYIQSALEAGIKTLGFSDHGPYFFPGDYYSCFRMRPEELAEYVATLQRLRETYRDKLALHIGLELEYYPAQFPELLPYLQEGGVEYLLLGQHFPGEEIGMWSSGGATEDPARLEIYCRTAMEGMNTGVFTYFAHPDLLHFVGDDKTYTRYMRALCREAKGCNLPLEINLLGIRDGRHYPTRRFWEVAAEEGCAAVLGVDAHEPEAFAHPDQLACAHALVKELGLTLLDTVELRSIL